VRTIDQATTTYFAFRELGLEVFNYADWELQAAGEALSRVEEILDNDCERRLTRS